MPDESLEEICNKAQISRIHQTLVRERLILSGFEGIDHYFRRKGESNAQYLFTESIAPKRDQLREFKENKLMTGTYYLDVSEENVREFERLIRNANDDAPALASVG